MKSVDFYFDYSCPYAYLAHTQIDALCKKHRAELRRKPFLLGGVFKALGSGAGPMASMPMAKAKNNLLDMQRWADHFGVPLKMPAGHPLRTVVALRATLASGDIARASEAFYRAYWVLGRDISQPEVLREVLDGAGFDGASLLDRANDEAVKKDLFARTDEALAAGVFGAPAFVVHPAEGPTSFFWGQDRLDFVAKALEGWTPNPPATKRQTEATVAGDLQPKVAFDFFFDFSSPFAYLASTQVEAVARRHGAVVRYRPILLGGLFKSIGSPNVPFFSFPPPKQKHYADDMVRWADHWGVPFRFPTRFPMNTVRALRMLLAIPEPSRASFIEGVFSAYWALDQDVSDENVLAGIARASGHDPAPLLAMSETSAIKEQLRAATDAAERLGVCGVPTFRVGEDLFWGQDRFVFVEKALDTLAKTGAAM